MYFLGSSLPSSHHHNHNGSTSPSNGINNISINSTAIKHHIQLRRAASTRRRLSINTNNNNNVNNVLPDSTTSHSPQNINGNSNTNGNSNNSNNTNNGNTTFSPPKSLLHSALTQSQSQQQQQQYSRVSPTGKSIHLLFN